MTRVLQTAARLGARRWLNVIAGVIFPIVPACTLVGTVDDDPLDENGCPQFEYEGDRGPENWGSLCPTFDTCDEGESQSPIDITGAVEGDAPGIVFNYQPTTFTVVNTGETVRADSPPGNTIVIGDTTYTLAQFHFHLPSEHTIDGQSYPMEMHLVHRSEGGELVVVGLLIESGADSPTLAPVFDNLPQEVEGTYVTETAIDLTELLPVDRAHFRYSGSLTTPPCTEGLTWSVIAAPIELSEDQIGAFDELYDFDNNRPTQPVNDRTITIVP